MPRKQSLVAAIAGGLVLVSASSPSIFAQEGTPPSALPNPCDTFVASVATPEAMARMEMSTPHAGSDHKAMDLDLMYIDMMIPHHASIIAMAEAALPRLSDERLREMALAIVAKQQPEIDELRELRHEWYGDPAPMTMDGAMMKAMAKMMPGMSGSMEEMAFQMDAEAQVAAICGAGRPDIAFVDLTIPHHRMAIEASRALLDQPEHAELQAFAQRVITAQQREIDELTAIRQELAAEATPAS